MFSQILPLAIRNLMRARTRLLLTTSGILIGTCAVIMLIAFSIGLQDAAESGLGSNRALTEINITSKPASDGGNQLDAEDIKKFKRLTGIKAIIPEVTLQSVSLAVKQYSGYRQVVGIDPALLPYVGVPLPGGRLALKSGEGVSGSDLGINFSTQLVTASNGAQNEVPINVDFLTSPLQLKLTKAVPPTEMRSIDLKIAAQFNPGTNYDGMLILPIEDVIALNDWVMGVKPDPKKVRYEKITIVVQSRDLTRKVSKAIEKLGYAPYGLGDMLDQINSLFSTMRIVLGGIGVVALLIAASGVANTMMMVTFERTKEIGLMKAVGATDQDILSLFLLESGLIGLAGGMGGVGTAFLLRDLINRTIKGSPTGTSGPSFLPIDLSKLANPIVIPSDLAMFGIVLAILVCMGAGLYPALWAARLSPVVALKQE
jgi:putative ABC transport system permease protein